ncbi:synaptic vesicle glycoprotein 2B-like [Bradysia coprophila]|uniref:synaptic vesicle glycoprotein 2B-like n=1 Tax=Bradysia coprophila TaxID=38358 RepID=UPI00187D90E4|nr:synaptic vesicle glycoprotein 2B-like [Bradysia coprophila]
MVYTIDEESSGNGPSKSSHTFEEAVTLIGNGKFHFILLIATGCSLLGVIMEGLNMAIVLPAAKCDIEITTTEQGLINTVGFIGVVLTSHFWGFMSDTWGRLKVLRFALFWGFTFSIASSFVTTSKMLLIMRFLVGFFLSGVQAAALLYLGEFHCYKNRAKYVTFAAMFMPMSIVYQPVMGWLIMTMDWKYTILGFVYRPWRLYMVLSSLINAFAYCLFLFLPESPKFMLAMGKPEEALDILVIGYKANGGKDKFPVTQISLESIGSNLADTRKLGATVKMMWDQTWPLFKPPYFTNIILLCYLAFVSFFVGHGLYMWYPQILALSYPNMNARLTMCEALAMTWSKQEYEIIDTVTSEVIEFSCQLENDSTTYQIILVMGLTFCCIYGLVALNVKRCGKSLLFPIWLLVSTTTTLCIIWADIFYFHVVLTIFMISCGYCGSIITAVAVDLFPTHYKGMALCLVMMFGRIGAVVGSNFVGALLDGECSAIFTINASLLLVATIICFIVMRKTDSIIENNS